jgi:guanylate kinase
MAEGENGLLLVVCGPAGSGKTTLCDRLQAEFPHIGRVVTSTTRAPREGEREGVDYHFRTVEAFQAMIEAGEFYEWAQVHGRYYGSERAAVRGPLAAGKDLLLNIDVQGAASYRAAAAEDSWLANRLLTVFIRPTDLVQIEERLLGRGTDDENEIAKRLRTAELELPHARHFDEVIVSGTREADYAAFRALYLKGRER